MAKRNTPKKRPAVRAARAAAARPRRRSSGIKGLAKIPKLGAAAGFVAANWTPITREAKRTIDNPRTIGANIKSGIQDMVRPEMLKKTAIYMVGGYLGGKVFKKFAPKAVKKPVAKIAQKVM